MTTTGPVSHIIRALSSFRCANCSRRCSCWNLGGRGLWCYSATLDNTTIASHTAALGGGAMEVDLRAQQQCLGASTLWSDVVRRVPNTMAGAHSPFPRGHIMHLSAFYSASAGIT